MALVLQHASNCLFLAAAVTVAAVAATAAGFGGGTADALGTLFLLADDVPCGTSQNQEDHTNYNDIVHRRFLFAG